MGKKKGAESTIITGFLMTAVFGGIWLSAGGWFWAIPMVFAGVLPLAEGLRALLRRRQAERLLTVKTQAQDERQVLTVAKAENGKVTPALIALKTELNTAKAEQILEHMVKKGYATIQVHASGHIEYEFPEFLPES